MPSVPGYMERDVVSAWERGLEPLPSGAAPEMPSDLHFLARSAGFEPATF
jgi:hypothetical protein